MIQELLGGGGAAGLSFEGDQRNKISIGRILEGTPTSSPCNSSTTSSTATTTTTTNSANNSESNQQNNLRCPRCDSSNTKFCYYNNYNLTQPRHFCKTCRRYWTKGGALRNVPIGGGCRKNRNTSTSTSTSTSVSTSLGKSSSAAAAAAVYNKMKTVVSDIGRSGFDNQYHDQLQYSSNPMLWASPQSQSSHLLALLTSTNTSIKEEEMSFQRSHVHGAMNEPAVVASGAALNARTSLGLDSLISQVPSLGLCTTPFWKNNNQQNDNNNNNNGFLVGEVQNNTGNIQELYQRLKYSDHSSAVVLSNVGSSSSSSSSILESAPAMAAAGGELGYWNPAFSSSWSHLPTPNGAYQ